MNIRDFVRSAVRCLTGALIPAFALASFYLMPIPGTASTADHGGAAAAPARAMPAVPQVRLLPVNDIANPTGVVTVQVTNLTSRKGHFRFGYYGETLVGEARKGVATAHGNRGTLARCEYRLDTLLAGTGICRLSDGAEYQLHIGS